MRDYECVYILDPALAEDELGALSERFRQVVLGQGGSVEVMDKWERRRLAYEVKGKREGVYYIMNFSANPGVESELQRVLRLTEGVLRHIVVKLDDTALKHMHAQAALRAQAQAAAAAQPQVAAPETAAAQPPQEAAPETAAAQPPEAAPEPTPPAPAEPSAPAEQAAAEEQSAPPESTEPPTTEPAIDEATEAVVAASEDTETEESGRETKEA